MPLLKKSGSAVTIMIACFVLLAHVAQAQPERGLVPGEGRRVALVIGNGAYRYTTPLPNPPNDARDMAVKLRRIGFEVIEGFNVERRGLERLVRDFAREVRGADAALFFYAGHGLEVAGKNYLIPVDAEPKQVSDLPFETVGLDTVTGVMDGPIRTSLVFLDACRDNPLTRSLARSTSDPTRSLGVGRGLAQMDTPAGMFVAFATRPGTTAVDGTGRNSPFTAALLANVEMPGLEVRQVMTRVRQNVLRATGNRQQPWDESSLVKDFYFVPPIAPAPSDADQEQAAFWEGVLRSGRDPLLFEEYLRRFPDGSFASLAQGRLDELRAALGSKSQTNALDLSGPKTTTLKQPEPPLMETLQPSEQGIKSGDFCDSINSADKPEITIQRMILCGADRYR